MFSSVLKKQSFQRGNQSLLVFRCCPNQLFSSENVQYGRCPWSHPRIDISARCLAGVVSGTVSEFPMAFGWSSQLAGWHRCGFVCIAQMAYVLCHRQLWQPLLNVHHTQQKGLWTLSLHIVSVALENDSELSLKSVSCTTFDSKRLPHKLPNLTKFPQNRKTCAYIFGNRNKTNGAEEL